MRRIVRWTIGPVSPAGFECLAESVARFLSIYDCEPFICHNQLNPEQIEFLQTLKVSLVDQKDYVGGLEPLGVAWKLYPARLDHDAYELFLDNDLIIEQKIGLIDAFFESDFCLLLEEQSRNYGQFEPYVPAGYCINSGLFGIPPRFDLARIISSHVNSWQVNTVTTSKTFDEQGLVAWALSAGKHLVLPMTEVVNCEYRYQPAPGMHFVGLNRKARHSPYKEYRASKTKLFI